LRIARDLKLSSTAQSGDQAILTTTQRIGWALLIALTLYLCYFSNLSVTGFVGPDEPRYAWIARDMAETGDWVTPRLYGKPWFEKPPLLYWGGAIFFKLLGEGNPEVAARLPSAICALLATLALAWLAWRTCGEECARWLLLFLPTSVGMIGFAHAAATDMPFSGMLTIAMVCAAVVLGLTRNENTPILPYTPWLALLLFGFSLGLAVLAKGPAAVILCGGAVFFWAVFTKRWRDALCLLHPAAIASFSVTALPWFILCARRNPDFFRIFIIEHNFKRYLTPEFQHIQPFWFYLPVLLAAFLPWSLLVFWAGAKGLRHPQRARHSKELTCLMLTWAGFCLLFFTASKSKLPGYVLPAVPAIGFLLALGISEEKLIRRRMTGIMLLCSGGCYLAAAICFRVKAARELSGAYTHKLSFEQLVLAFFIALLFFAIAGCFGASFLTRSKSTGEILFVAAGVLLLATSFTLASRMIDRANLHLLSGKALALSFRADPRATEPLRLFGFKRDYRYALNFYLHEEVLDWKDDPIRKGFVLSKGSDCAKLGTADQCADLWDVYDRNVSWGLLKITPADSLSRNGGGGQPK
jgi:4-amino-4-deoxy-L-arabinose transferase-like glycosyltransferase